MINFLILTLDKRNRLWNLFPFWMLHLIVENLELNHYGSLFTCDNRALGYCLAMWYSFLPNGNIVCDRICSLKPGYLKFTWLFAHQCFCLYEKLKSIIVYGNHLFWSFWCLIRGFMIQWFMKLWLPREDDNSINKFNLFSDGWMPVIGLVLYVCATLWVLSLR